MKHILALAVALSPTIAIAGTLTPLTEGEGLSALASGISLEGTATASGLSASAPLLGLRGRAPITPIDGLSLEGGLDGLGDGSALTGFAIAPPPPPPPEAVVEPLPEPIRFNLSDLHFEYDSATLMDTERPVIAELAAIIVRTAPKSITLIGYTDRRGETSYNLQLSYRRALAVQNALVNWHGLDAALFHIIGKGEAELLSAGLTEADHARDRRVVVILEVVK